MNIGAIIAATVLVAAVGLFIGVFLGVAGKKFAVEVDEKEVAVREALPGNNCGGCGYPGCIFCLLPCGVLRRCRFSPKKSVTGSVSLYWS